MSIDLQQLTGQIVSAYVANNNIAANELPALIQGVYSALSRPGAAPAEQAPTEPQKPAVPIRRSVTPDAVYCLECGKGQKMLKRHLRGEHDMTADEYRAKWGLPPEYPMVAPTYAAARSEMAKSIGLGRHAGAGRKGRK